MSMIPIAFITFRESMEIVFVIGLLLTSITQLKLNKQYDLYLGAGIGVLLSISLFIIFSFAGSRLHLRIDEEIGELIEGINYFGSGVFLFITAVILHDKMRGLTQKPSLLVDTSLIAVGFLSTLREGIEIIFFSIPSSLTTSFYSSLLGFTLGISCAFFIAFMASRMAISRLSSKYILAISDWGVRLLALYFIVKGGLVLLGFIFSF